MKGELTLGDLRKLDLPDDTPIVLAGKVWDYDSAQSAEVVLGGQSNEPGHWLDLSDPAMRTYRFRFCPVVVIARSKK